MSPEVQRETSEPVRANLEWVRASSVRSRKQTALAWLVFLACCGLLLGITLVDLRP